MHRLINAGLVASAIGLGLMVLLLSWASSRAEAQVPCLVGPPEMLAQLLARSGEQPLIEMQMSGGENAPTMPGLFTVSPEGGFTLFMLDPSGAVCIIAVGTSAQPATGKGFPKPVIPGEDS